jgi:CBS domain-containing membrane protein
LWWDRLGRPGKIESESELMKIRDVMRHDPVSVSETTPVSEVLELVHRLSVRHVPVLNHGELVGIISDRDLREVATPALLPKEARPLLGLPARNVMSTDVVALGPDDDAARAIDLIIETGVGAIPVLEPDSTRLVGIVSYVDLLRAARPLIAKQDDD